MSLNTQNDSASQRLSRRGNQLRTQCCATDEVTGLRCDNGTNPLKPYCDKHRQQKRLH